MKWFSSEQEEEEEEEEEASRETGSARESPPNDPKIFRICFPDFP